MDEKLIEILLERFDNLEKSFKSELELTRVELKTEIKNVRDELKTEIKNVRDELKMDICKTRNDIEMTRDELKTEIQNVYNEVKELRNDLTAIEFITKDNLYDIAKLKSIK